ncbi:MAG: hypothetical protein EOP84_19875, partial [Verrucomicrobiaceae bacterium]
MRTKAEIMAGLGFRENRGRASVMIGHAQFVAGFLRRELQLFFSDGRLVPGQVFSGRGQAIVGLPGALEPRLRLVAITRPLDK